MWNDSFHTCFPPRRSRRTPPLVNVFVSGNLINCCLVVTAVWQTPLEASIVCRDLHCYGPRGNHISRTQPQTNRQHFGEYFRKCSMDVIQILAALFAQICCWKQKDESRGSDIDAEIQRRRSDHLKSALSRALLTSQPLWLAGLILMSPRSVAYWHTFHPLPICETWYKKLFIEQQNCHYWQGGMHISWECAQRF